MGPQWAPDNCSLPASENLTTLAGIGHAEPSRRKLLVNTLRKAEKEPEVIQREWLSHVYRTDQADPDARGRPRHRARGPRKRARRLSRRLGRPFA